jgi:hypothetical protein
LPPITQSRLLFFRGHRRVDADRPGAVGRFEPGAVHRHRQEPGPSASRRELIADLVGVGGKRVGVGDRRRRQRGDFLAFAVLEDDGAGIGELRSEAGRGGQLVAEAGGAGQAFELDFLLEAVGKGRVFEGGIRFGAFVESGAFVQLCRLGLGCQKPRGDPLVPHGQACRAFFEVGGQADLDRARAIDDFSVRPLFETFFDRQPFALGALVVDGGVVDAGFEEAGVEPEGVRRLGALARQLDRRRRYRWFHYFFATRLHLAVGSRREGDQRSRGNRGKQREQEEKHPALVVARHRAVMTESQGSSRRSRLA